MKWYSVKKYRPFSYDRVICRVLEDDESETILMGCYCGIKNRWDFNEIPMNDPAIYIVTHFCIPDPIEIEE